MNRPAINLGLVVALVVVVFLFATFVLWEYDGGARWGWNILALTLVVTMVTTLFGVLALPGGLEKDGSFREQRIRFAIATTLVVVYFVLFSNAVFWPPDDEFIDDDMLNTLTQLMYIVLPFYFGTSGLVEYGKIKQARNNANSKEND